MNTKFKATLLATIIFSALSLAHAQTFTMLHTFTGTDGANPQSTLMEDAAGNLYGTTLLRRQIRLRNRLQNGPEPQSHRSL